MLVCNNSECYLSWPCKQRIYSIYIWRLDIHFYIGGRLENIAGELVGGV